MSTTERGILEAKVLPELQAIASSMGVQGYQRLRKADLIGAIIAKAQGVEFVPSATASGRGRRGSTVGLDTAVAEAPAQQALPGSDGSEAPGADAPNGEARPSRRRRTSVGAAAAVAAAVAAADGVVSDGPGTMASESSADPGQAATDGGSESGQVASRPAATDDGTGGDVAQSQPAQTTSEAP